MNILVFGKSKTGTTIISRTILKSLTPHSEYIFEPKDITPFRKKYDSKHTVTKVLFDAWLNKKNLLRNCLENKYELKIHKHIVIHRDPRDQIISVLLYYPFNLQRRYLDSSLFNEWIEFLRKKEQNPDALSFLAMCEKFDSLFKVNLRQSLNRRGTFDQGYLRFCQNLSPHYALKYEDFMSGNIGDLSKYLGISIADDRDVGEKYRNTYRTGSLNNWKRYFTSEDIDFFRQYSDYFELLGYDDWKLEPVSSIPETELSAYVRKLLGQKD